MPVTCDVRLRLARAVAREDTGFALRADNRAGIRGSLAELVAGGGAFAVVPSRRLFVVDSDPSGLDADAGARLRVAFDALVAAAHDAGVPVVVTASGRPGHRHAFLLADGCTPDTRAGLTLACRRAGLDVRDTGVRPPLTPHRAGLPVTLIEPTDPRAAASLLEGPGSTGPEAFAELAAALGAPRLSLRVRRLLRDGHTAVGLPSASEGRMTVAVAVRGVGLPLAYLAALLDDPAHVLTVSYRARPLRWRRRELDRLWVKAGRWLLEHPLTEDTAEGRQRMAATWRSALAAVAWPGVGAASALAVAEALGDLAVRLGRPRVGAALDEVAHDAGLSRDATRGALRRLTAAGWLVVAEESTATRARTYELTLPGSLDAHQVTVAARAGDAALLDGGGFADLGADAARWSGGIGKSAARVLRALAGEPVPVAHLTAALHMSANAVRIHLRRLSALGVVVCDGRRRWQRTGVDADQLAVRLGVAGARDRQRAAADQRRAERAALRSSWRAAVGQARAALRAGDLDGWSGAAQVLPHRLLAAHVRWAARRGPVPAWASLPSSA